LITRGFVWLYDCVYCQFVMSCIGWKKTNIQSNHNYCQFMYFSVGLYDCVH
jgi:hypothetical protein